MCVCVYIYINSWWDGNVDGMESFAGKTFLSRGLNMARCDFNKVQVFQI